MKYIFKTFLILILISGFIYAAAPVGTATGQFLTIGVGGREIAMGEAVTASSNGAGSVFWNPAGLVDSEQKDVFAAYNQWPAGIHVGAVSAAVSNPVFGSFAMHVKYVNFGEIEITTIDNPNGTGASLLMSNYAVGFTYGKYLTDKVSVGATVNYVKEQYGSNGYNTLAFDVGILYRASYNNLKIGMSVLNFAPEVQYSGTYIDYSFYDSYATGTEVEFDSWSLPMTFRFGAAMDIYQEGANKLTAAFDMVHPNDNREQYNMGMEYNYGEKMFLRLGYKLTSDIGGFSGGLGFVVNSLVLDYSLSSLGKLGLTNRLSVGFKL